MFTKTTATNWHTTKGRELIRLLNGADQAEIIIAKGGEEELRALASACQEAADAIRDAREAREHSQAA